MKRRSWTLNAAQDRYAATNLQERAVDLHLALKRLDGTRVPVGRFHLDLEDLARRGYVTKRGSGASAVFDVQIYREPGERYLLGVGLDRRTPLEAFAV